MTGMPTTIMNMEKSVFRTGASFILSGSSTSFEVFAIEFLMCSGKSPSIGASRKSRSG